MKNYLHIPVSLVVSALLLCSWHTSEAQLADTLYDFSNFVLPEIHYQGLEFSGQMKASGSRTGASSAFPAQRSLGSSLGGTCSYFALFNSPKAQHSHDLRLTFDVAWEKHKGLGDDRNITASPYIVGRHHNRWYTGNKFVEFSLLHYTHLEHDGSRQPDRSTGYFDTGVRLKPFVLFGTGRIEPISDVNLAYFLIRDLDEQGLLTRELSNDDMNILGQRMANARYRRLFDFRVRRKHELAAIDSLISGEGWISDYSIDYFTTLTDNWQYSFRPSRSQGRRLSYGIAPQVRYAYTSTTVDETGQPELKTDFDSHEINVYALLQYSVEKPLSLTWQRFYGGELTLGYEHRSLESIPPGLIGADKGPGGNIMGFYGYGFYPNSRTSVSTQLFGRYRGQVRNDQFGYVLHLSLGSSMSYFLSPRARLIGSLNIDWSTFDNYSGPLFVNDSIYFYQDAPLYGNYNYIFPRAKRISGFLDIRLAYSFF